MSSRAFPRDFASRRWHSFLGLWIALYVMFHLLTNSQAALFPSEHGAGFIRDVNWIHNLPFLPVLEIVIIALPFVFHAILGIRYAITSKANNYGGKGDRPQLTKYGANHAYSWQRISAWILLVLIIFHVVQMRFVDYPEKIPTAGMEPRWEVEVTDDPGLQGVVDRMGAQIIPGEGDTVSVVADSFGEVTLLNVRNTFKSVTMMILYSVLVVAGVYHGFRGLWSFAITWGITLTKRSQRWMNAISIGLMIVFGCLGLAAVWLTTWVTLK